MTKNEFMKEFSDVLKLHIDVNYLNYTDICKVSNVTKASLLGYLNGTRLPSIPVMVRLCDDLGVSRTTVDILVKHRESLEQKHDSISRYEFERIFIEDVEDGMDFCNTNLNWLSSYLNIRLKTLMDYMTHRATPRKKTISRIYKALDFEPDEIEKILELRDRIK